MNAWDVWDWVAYGGLWIAALVLARETLLPRPAEAGRSPALLSSPKWRVVPLIFLILSGAAFLAKVGGIVGAGPPISQECMTAWGRFDDANLQVRAAGRCFLNQRASHYLAAVAFHYFKKGEFDDAPLQLKGATSEIQDSEIILKIPIAGEFLEEINRGTKLTFYALLLVPRAVLVSDFSTLREAIARGATVVSRRGGPP